MARQRLDALDGLRGIAAIAVLIHHAGTQVAGAHLLPAGHLAVDFFFMLSGFVVAKAYEPRLAAGLAVPALMRIRLARLYPIIALGIIAGAAMTLALDGAPPEVMARLAAQLLFIPVVIGAAAIFPLNGVQWSLYFELIANALHGAILWKLRTSQLAFLVLALLPALWLAAAYFGSMGTGDRGDNILGGFPRVLFSYCAGVLLYRLWSSGRLPRIEVSPQLLFILLPCVLLFAGHANAVVPRWIIEPLIISTLWPVLLIIGLSCSIPRPLAGATVLLGLISYPLYALHLPAIMAVQWLMPDGPRLAALAAAIVLALATSCIVGRLMEPGPRRPARPLAAPASAQLETAAVPARP